MKHWCPVVMVVGLSCGPAATSFFGEPPAGHELIGPIVDTALIRNLDTDSVDAEGVRWLIYAAEQSVVAGREQIGARLGVMAATHLGSVPDSLHGGDPTLDLWNRLSAQSPVQRMNIARADALTIPGRVFAQSDAVQP